MVTNRPNDDQFLNVFRYEGTQTFPPCDPAVYFVYGGALFVDDLTDITTKMKDNDPDFVTLREGSENSRTVNSGGGSLTVERLCFSGYVKAISTFIYNILV